MLAVLVALVLVRVVGDRQVSDALRHLEEFQELADEYGDRATGSPGYEAAAEYVEEQLEDAGYESDRQYFTFENRGEEYESFNIIAETDTGSDENVVMLGAHLDGVEDSAAINDNASGVAALLEAAKEVGRQDGINNKVRFVWWGAEEFPESYGSRHYVKELAEDNGDGLDSIAAYLNFDMVASPNPVIGVYNARGAGRPWLEVPEGSEKVMEVFTDYFGSRDQPWTATTWNMASDQVAFIREDVAVGGLFTGSDVEKSAREARIFGGEAGRPMDPNYHSPGDDLDNIDPEALDLMTDAIIHAATRLAQDTSALD
ncbi:M28 family peptidase [Citricoccus alkalitolerans]|uniref:M28 family peptidase n=1 Tax=Citricoccus alkalitolerans TaxID=246603 RepID=A0ABV8XX82_9MICC